jgi:hypothetical protein
LKIPTTFSLTKIFYSSEVLTISLYIERNTAWQRLTLAGAKPQLPSALESLTSVFGMETGVTSPLLLPDILVIFIILHKKDFIP